ncbi:MAG: MarR family transcriptional regulator [Spirochaetia bacterium]
MNAGNVSDIREFRRALRYLERVISSNVKDNSVCCGVTPTQCHLLLKVEEAGEISPSELKEYLGLDKSSLSRTIDGLVRLSLLERRESSTDRRYHSISLTERGGRFVERLNEECDAYYKPIYESLPEEIRVRILEDFEALSKASQQGAIANSKRRCCSIEEIDGEGEEV